MNKKPIIGAELNDCAEWLAKKLPDQKISAVAVENGNVLVLSFDSGRRLYIAGATEIAIIKAKVAEATDKQGE